MRIVDRGTIFMGEAGTEYSSACFPAICVLPSGRWLAGFRASPKKADAFPQRSVLSWSDDEGRTWTQPSDPFVPPRVNGAPGVFRCIQCTPLGGRKLAGVLYWVDASDPRLPIFNEQTEGILDSYLFLSFSEDNGATWSSPRRLENPAFPFPTPITGAMLVLSNGDWAIHFETNKTYYDTSVWHHASVLLFSRDQGQTWPEHVKVAADPEARVFYWDQRPAVVGPKSVLDVFWTFDRQRAVYLNIHARLSNDYGRTWSEIWDCGIPGQPAPPVRLPDGRIALAYMDREGPPLLKMRVSRDEGRTWPQDTEIILYDSTRATQQEQKSTMQDAWSEMAKFSVGLPTTARLANGDVLVAHYAGPSTDHTGVHWVRVGP